MYLAIAIFKKRIYTMDLGSHNDKNQKPAETVSEVRRKLVLASAAVPIVATLHPGAAMAASSAFQCTGGDFSNKKFFENGNSINGDTAVRVEVPYFQILSGHANEVKTLANKLYLIEGTLYDQAGRDYPYSNENIDLLEDHYYENTAFVLVLINMSSGCPEQLGPWPKYQLEVDGGMGTALTQSCWTSIMQSECTL